MTSGAQDRAPGSRWSARTDVPRGTDYDERWDRLAASGAEVHGEAALVADLARGQRVLDAGCGTGRVAIELARRGFAVTGVDLDEPMLAEARRKTPELHWVQADVSTMNLGEEFDAVVLAGNVMIFVHAGTEAATVATCADHLTPGGLLIAGFQLRPDGYTATDLNSDAIKAGLVLVDRWSTWARHPYEDGGDYQVSVHRRPLGGAPDRLRNYR